MPACIALAAHALACGRAATTARPIRSMIAVDDAPQVRIGNGVAIVRAEAQTRWQKVINALDHVRESGTTRFVLEVSGEPPRRSAELEFPRSSQLDERGLVFVDLDDTANLSHVPANDVVLRAPAQAQFADVVDAVRLLQRQGARVIFSVAAPPPMSAPAARPKLAVDGMAPCPFPPESDAAKIDDAAVIVEVDVAPSGRASSVRVLSDPGHGFGRAAQACALAARYEPARDATGAVIPASTKLRIHFERPPP